MISQDGLIHTLPLANEFSLKYLNETVSRPVLNIAEGIILLNKMVVSTHYQLKFIAYN